MKIPQGTTESRTESLSTLRIPFLFVLKGPGYSPKRPRLQTKLEITLEVYKISFDVVLKIKNPT